MHYRYEKLLDDLKTIEDNILFKESQFLDCWCYDSTDCELIDIYFSSEYCILIVILPCGTQVKVTVKMDVSQLQLKFNIDVCTFLCYLAVSILFTTVVCYNLHRGKYVFTMSLQNGIGYSN